MSTTQETGRIRWEEVDPGKSSIAWRGFAGTLSRPVFEIGRPVHLLTGGLGQWMLSFSIHDQVTDRHYGDDPEALKATAERWLEEFVSSLGAVFRGPACEHCGSGLHRDDKDSCWLGADGSDCCPGAVYHQPAERTGDGEPR